jgi:hypothetical protein
MGSGIGRQWSLSRLRQSPGSLLHGSLDTRESSFLRQHRIDIEVAVEHGLGASCGCRDVPIAGHALSEMRMMPWLKPGEASQLGSLLHTTRTSI